MSTWSLTYQRSLAYKQYRSNKNFSAFYSQNGGEKNADMLA